MTEAAKHATTEKNRTKAIEKKAEKNLHEAQAKLFAASGPFMCAIEKQLKALNLKRCAYHGGVLVGNDVHKLYNRPITSGFLVFSYLQS